MHPVSPRITRPEPLAVPLAAGSGPPVERQRSFIRSATLATVILSIGALIGFVSADATRDAREPAGVVALAPTPSTAGQPSSRPSSEPAASAAASDAPSTTPGAAPTAVAVGPAMSPVVATLGNSLTSGGIELDLAWPVPADGSAVSRYDLRVARDGGDYQRVGLARRTARGESVGATAGHEYAFQVRARGADGTAGDYATSAVRLSRSEEDDAGVEASGGWKIARHPAYGGAGARYATSKGAELTLTFDGTGVAIVGPTGPGRGRADVFVDGQRVGRFDATGSTFRPSRLLYTVDGLADGPHVLVVRVAGTSGRPMVAVDRFLVLSQS